MVGITLSIGRNQVFPEIYPRFAQSRKSDSLTGNRVVLISGPRQSRKTTLAKHIASDHSPFLTLDEPTVLQSALDDPSGFIRGLDRATIDEIQRAPGLLLPIKNSVDDNPDPGRFLLAGSANLMTIPKVADSLAGRMEVVRLLPLSQTEILDCKSDFIDRAFGNAKPYADHFVIGTELVDIVLAGGYPLALERRTWARKQDWYHNYVDAIVQRDIRDIAQIDQLSTSNRLAFRTDTVIFSTADALLCAYVQLFIRRLD